MKLKYQKIILSLISICLTLVSCEEYKQPGPIVAPSSAISETPQITSVIPADSAIAGVRYLTIEGTNFLDNISDTLLVYLDGKKLLLKDVTNNSIVAHRPNIYGGNLTLSVVKSKALAVAHMTGYGVENPIESFGDFSRQAYQLTDIEVGSNEELYVATRRRILRLTPDGINLDTLANLGSAFAKITDLKIGPGGFIYAAASKNDLYKISLTTGEDESHFRFSRKVDYFDFDASGNIYAGRRDGIFVLTTDLTEVATGLYDDLAIKEIRVFAGAVYVATAKKLSRNIIQDNQGSLGAIETIIDLETLPEFSSSDISSFNIDEEGRILVCLTGHPSYSVFVVEPDFTLTPYYKTSIIPRRIDQLIFGNDRYLYLNRGISIDPVGERDSVKVYKMGLDKLGAPYNGRN